MEEGVQNEDVGIKPLLRVLEGKHEAVPPVWMMRQAGRYLPEYRAVRETAGGFLDLCFNPELAAEVTLQPIRRFGFDAAIRFPDILVVPLALGRKVWFVEGEGPRLEPMQDAKDMLSFQAGCQYAYLAADLRDGRQCKSEVGCANGADRILWRAVDGCHLHDCRPRNTRSGAGKRKWPRASRRSSSIWSIAWWDASADYLARQLEAGADVVQIFDSWAGALPAEDFECWCVQPTKQLVAKLRAKRPGAKVSAFRAARTKIFRAMSKKPRSTPSALATRSTAPSRAMKFKSTCRCRAMSIRRRCLRAAPRSTAKSTRCCRRSVQGR